MSIAYLSSGNPAHPPLIFLHGFLGSKEDWLEWFPFFENDHHCVAIDLPGHGSSALSSCILEAIRLWILSYCRTTPKVIGYSLGGRIALQLQEIFSTLAILSAHPGLSSEEERKERLKADLQWITQLSQLPLTQFLKKWYAQPVFSSLQRRGDLLQRLMCQRERNSASHLAEVLSVLSLGRQPLITLAPNTSFFYGKEDWKYQKIYATLPSLIQVHAIADAGHMVHLENPSLCAQKVKEVFDVHDNRKKSDLAVVP